MRCTWVFGVTVLVQLATAVPAAAQAIPKTDYVTLPAAGNSAPGSVLLAQDVHVTRLHVGIGTVPSF